MKLAVAREGVLPAKRNHHGEAHCFGTISSFYPSRLKSINKLSSLHPERTAHLQLKQAAGLLRGHLIQPVFRVSSHVHALIRVKR